MNSCEFEILKSDSDKKLVFGWASISITIDGEQLEDRQQDVIDPEDLEQAAYEYVLNFRDAGEEHISTMRKKGKLVESCVLTEEKQKAMGIPAGTIPIGWWIGFKIEDDAAWERVKNGTYQMFSIEGQAERVPVNSANVSRYDVIYESGNEYDWIVEVGEFNPYHDSKGRFTHVRGATSFTYKHGKSKAHDNAVAHAKEGAKRRANRKYGVINLKDAVGENRNAIREGRKFRNSLYDHIDENGKLMPEREKIHRQIIDDILIGKEPVKGTATMTMLGGGPASGKSSVMSADTSKDKHAITVDPDYIKTKLPGYSKMAKETSEAASFYHEESSALAKRLAEVAYRENYNVVYDGTGDGSNNSVQKKMDAARRHGYTVNAVYVSVNTETAVARNKKRYEDAKAAGENPRLVPDDVVRKTHAKCTDISVAMAPKFDHIEVWDNNGVHGQQKKIAEGGNGKSFIAIDREKFNNYLSKGTKGLENFITLPDGQVVPVDN